MMSSSALPVADGNVHHSMTTASFPAETSSDVLLATSAIYQPLDALVDDDVAVPPAALTSVTSETGEETSSIDAKSGEITHHTGESTTPSQGRLLTTQGRVTANGCQC